MGGATGGRRGWPALGSVGGARRCRGTRCGEGDDLPARPRRTRNTERKPPKQTNKHNNRQPKHPFLTTFLTDDRHNSAIETLDRHMHPPFYLRPTPFSSALLAQSSNRRQTAYPKAFECLFDGRSTTSMAPARARTFRQCGVRMLAVCPSERGAHGWSAARQPRTPSLAQASIPWVGLAVAFGSRVLRSRAP